MSKVYTDQIEKRTGGTAMDVPASGKWDTANIADDAIDTAQIASDAIDTAQIASGAVGATELDATLDLSTKTVTLPAASVTDHVVPYDDNTLKEEIALLGFRTAANGSLAKYNLVDQTIDAFEDATGIDASASTGEHRNASNYYSGGASGTVTGGTITTHGVYTVHSFLSGTTNFVTDIAGTADVLLVAGGGSGGGSHANQGSGGGGGGGGVRALASQSVSAATHAVTVGAGATGSQYGNNGVDSSIVLGSTLTASGGGGGGFGTSDTSDTRDGLAGASGGGGGIGQTAKSGGAGNTPSTSPVQGYAGGNAATGGAGGGGGASEEQIENAFRIILADENVKGIFVNIFGGILRCDILARGVVGAAKKLDIKIPIVVRMEGTNMEEGHKILGESGIDVIVAEGMKDGAQKMVKAVK